jgi:hypothetical protein
MQVGDLVKITRASIGVPVNTVGLIVDKTECDTSTFPYYQYHVQMYGLRLPRTRRWLARDLEVVSASR